MLFLTAANTAPSTPTIDNIVPPRANIDNRRSIPPPFFFLLLSFYNYSKLVAFSTALKNVLNDETDKCSMSTCSIRSFTILRILRERKQRWDGCNDLLRANNTTLSLCTPLPAPNRIYAPFYFTFQIFSCQSPINLSALIIVSVSYGRANRPINLARS